jgi:competence protein ComEC
MLIDGGNRNDSDKMYTILRNNGIKTLDLLVGTHPDEDHIGGLAGALNYANAITTLCSTKSHDTKVFSDFNKYAEKNGGGIQIPNPGDQYNLGSAQVTILAVNSGSEPNDSSIVIKIVYGETSFLFTGDAEAEAEQWLLNSGYDLSADVLKVGHHGSSSSTSKRFLNAVNPTYGIISTGKDNTYGHPTEETLNHLRNAGVQIYRTDLQGDVFVSSDGKTVSITTQKNTSEELLLIPGVIPFSEEDNIHLYLPVSFSRSSGETCLSA